MHNTVPYRLPRIIFAFVLFLLAGCSNSNQANSAATQSNGPVSIETDHSSYAPDGKIQVTVRNTLTTSIYALDTQASCSILGLEALAQGTWHASSAARCPLGRPAMVVEIASGKSYTTTLQGSSSSSSDATLPSGTYRLFLNYATTADRDTIQFHPTIVTSANLAVS